MEKKFVLVKVLDWYDEDYEGNAIDGQVLGVFSNLEDAKAAMEDDVIGVEVANEYCSPNYGDVNEDGYVSDHGCNSGPIDDSGRNWCFIYGGDESIEWYIVETKTPDEYKPDYESMFRGAEPYLTRHYTEDGEKAILSARFLS